jgi:hypothetical protein
MVVLECTGHQSQAVVVRAFIDTWIMFGAWCQGWAPFRALADWSG